MLINTSSSVLKCQLGMTLAKLSRNDDALDLLQQAIDADRKNIISWIEKARVLQSICKNHEALEVLQGALVSRTPSQPDADSTSKFNSVGGPPTQYPTM